MEPKLKIGITGCNGRMGRLLVDAVRADSSFALAGGYDRSSADHRDIAFCINARDLFEASDLVIDFTSPDASLKHAQLAAETGTALLIGTTGLSDTQIDEIKISAAKAPILISANTSLGVTLLIQLTKKVSGILGSDYAIEILESHHKHKVDAPSGTALALGRAAAEGRQIDFEKHKSFDRKGARHNDDIGFATMRGGDVVGEHTVYFYGEGERIELTHRATDRKLFAKGAVQTAKWLSQQPPGFYTMDDFIKLF